MELQQLSQFVLFKTMNSGLYVNCSDDDSHRVRAGLHNIYDPVVKIEVEKAKTNSGFVHLRFCHNNRYWARRGPSQSDLQIFGVSGQPEEDTSKWSCTLFEPSSYNGFFYFIHVQTGGRVGYDTIGFSFSVYLDEHTSAGFNLDFVDWSTLVIMPKHVAFKGDNGKYLKAGWIEGHEYLEFSSDDGNEEASAYEVSMNPDGYLLVKSTSFGKFWRRSPNWIWADREHFDSDKDMMFWPVRVNKNTIALRNAGNNAFCKRLTTEGKTSCLNAAVPTITIEARLQVEELVLEREIVDVRYHLQDARIFDEKPFMVGTGSAENNGSEAASLSVVVSYEDTSSYCFTNSLSIMAGVETTIKAGFLTIVDGEIKVSAEVTNSLEWSRTTTETKKAEANYTTVVPAGSRVRVNYVATQGTCNVPFSYVQRDKLSSDGRIVATEHVDGIYTGVNCYNFCFEQVGGITSIEAL